MQALSKCILACVALLGAPAAAWATGYCFEIHDAQQLVYRSTIPPVDMSKPISQGMAEAGRAGQHLMFRLNTDTCEPFGDPSAPGAAPVAMTRLAGVAKPRRAAAPVAVVAADYEHQALLLDAALSNVAQRNPGSVADLPVSTGRTIYTGPRGGRYYVNSSGNKQYVSPGRRR